LITLIIDIVYINKGDTLYQLTCTDNVNPLLFHQQLNGLMRSI